MWLYEQRRSVSGRTSTDTQTGYKSERRYVKMKNSTISFHLNFFFSWLCGRLTMFFLSISSFDLLSWWRHPLFSHRCLDWVMFKSMLIFSFAWLHCEETLSTLGNRTQGEQSGRVLHIPPQPTHLSPSSLLPHQTFVIEPEISGWAALMPGAY